ncbi:MAG: DnaJ domain-containing protein [Bdellovibrionales bacterium]|nr:DnaJ domain-containing protein [Bdellovibrionales bacterium]
MKRSRSLLGSESALVRSYRDILGVGPNYTQDELKKQYRRLALISHPDHNPSEHARADFQRIRLAFETLSNPELIQKINYKERQSRLSRTLADGLKLTFGSFFGYRRFSSQEARFNQKRLTTKADQGKEGPALSDDSGFDFEENHSILDHPAYDSIEVAFAGKLSAQDEESLVQEQFDLEGFGNLPWVLLNNQGVLDFLEGRFQRAHRCYGELVRRIPNNIVFLYRLAVCEIVLAFQDPRLDWLLRTRPDQRRIKHAKKLLEHAIKLGAERSIGKQKCEVPKKLLADVLGWLGMSRDSKKLWQRISAENKRCVEAEMKVHGPSAAFALAKKLQEQTRSANPTDTKVLTLPQRNLKSR